MFVEYLNPSPKAGIREHVSREVAAALIAAGFARAAKMSDEDLQAASIAAGNPQVPFYHEPVWSFKDLLNGSFVVVRKIHTETLFYATPPADAPAFVLEEFARRKAAAGNVEWLREQQYQERMTAEAANKPLSRGDVERVAAGGR
jgi:hypothetical protein